MLQLRLRQCLATLLGLKMWVQQFRVPLHHKCSTRVLLALRALDSYP